MLCGSPPEQEGTNLIGNYVQRLKRNLDNVHRSARQRLNNQSLRSKARYDQKAREIHFDIGHNVWFFNPRRIKGRTPKLQSNWEGPYKIIRKLSDVVFAIQKSNRHKEKVVHADRLAPFYERRKF